MGNVSSIFFGCCSSHFTQKLSFGTSRPPAFTVWWRPCTEHIMYPVLATRGHRRCDACRKVSTLNSRDKCPLAGELPNLNTFPNCTAGMKPRHFHPAQVKTLSATDELQLCLEFR